MTPNDVLNSVRVALGLPALALVSACSTPTPPVVVGANETVPSDPAPPTATPVPTASPVPTEPAAPAIVPPDIVSLTRSELIELYTVDTDLGLGSNEAWVSECIRDHWEDRQLCDLRGVGGVNQEWLDAGFATAGDGCAAFNPADPGGGPGASLEIWPPTGLNLFHTSETRPPALYWLYWTSCTHGGGHFTKSVSGWNVHTGNADVLGTISGIYGRPYGTRVAQTRGHRPSDAAQRWVRRAQEEHASIASFARHILEMMSLGAPPDLLADISAAQQDEVRHTQLALSRAHALGANTLLGALDASLPPRVGARDIAIGVAVEGCVNETLAAMSIAAQTHHCPREERELLTTIADDETRHATLAWRTLAWLWPRLNAVEQADVRQHATDAAPLEAMAFLGPCFDALQPSESAVLPSLSSQT